MQKLGGHGLPLFSYSYLKLTICLILLKKHDANDLADPHSIKDVCHIWTLWWALLTIVSLWLSGWASGHRIQSSGVQFLLHGDLEFFSSSHACDKTWKHLSPFLYQAQNLPSSSFYLLIISNNLFHSLSAFVLAPTYLSPLVKLLFSFQSARKKRNRKKQAKTNDPETLDVAVIKENNEKVSQLNQNSLEGIVHEMEIREIFRLCKGNKKPSKIILH